MALGSRKAPMLELCLEAPHTLTFNETYVRSRFVPETGCYRYRTPSAPAPGIATDLDVSLCFTTCCMPLDAKQSLGVAAVAVAILAQSWFGQWGEPPPRMQRSGGPFNRTQLLHSVEPLLRIHVSSLNSPEHAAFWSQDAPYVLTGLCDPVPGVSADPCHLDDGTWSARSLSSGPGWSRVGQSHAEFYRSNMDMHTLLRKAVHLPLGQAVEAATGSMSDGSTAGGGDGADADITVPPRRYVHWNVDAEAWDALMASVLPHLHSRLPAPLRYTSQWLSRVLNASASATAGQQHGVAGDAAEGLGGSTPPSDAAAGGNSSSSGAGAGPASDWMTVTHWRMLLLGSAGAGMFNHRDTLAAGSWQLQLAGGKRWHLCPPSASMAVGDVDAGTGMLSAHVGLDMLWPGTGPGQAGTYRAHPRARMSVGCYLDVVRSGEAIVYPAGWWHQTENLVSNSGVLHGAELSRAYLRAAQQGASAAGAPRASSSDEAESEFGTAGGSRVSDDVSVAMTESVVTRSSWGALGEQMAANCRKRHRPGVTPSPRLCALLPQLVDEWRVHFQGPPGMGDPDAAAAEPDGDLAFAAMDL